jgi:hypothetical protein
MSVRCGMVERMMTVRDQESVNTRERQIIGCEVLDKSTEDERRNGRTSSFSLKRIMSK